MITLTCQSCCLFFSGRQHDVLGPPFGVVFRRVLRLGSFLSCWRMSNVMTILKNLPFSSVANNRPISIILFHHTPWTAHHNYVLSKVFEWMVSLRLGLFMEWRGVLPTTQLPRGKIWVLVMPYCVCVSHFSECIRKGAGGQNRSDRLRCSVIHSHLSRNFLQALLSGCWRFGALYSEVRCSLLGHIISYRLVVGLLVNMVLGCLKVVSLSSSCSS